MGVKEKICLNTRAFFFFFPKTKTRTSHDSVWFLSAARGFVRQPWEKWLQMWLLGGHGLGKIVVVLGLMVGLHDLEGSFQAR